MTARALLALCLLAGSAVPIRAQFAVVGENKIQYRRLDWQVLKGEHVDLYFYPEEAEIAPVALAYAEEAIPPWRLSLAIPSRRGFR